MQETATNKVSTKRTPCIEKWFLAAVLLVCLIVRLYGINHGLPYGYQIDEKWVVNRSVAFGTGDLNPHEFDAPGTTWMYLLFGEYALLFVGGWVLRIFSNPSDFAELFLTDPTIFYMLARLTAVALGMGTVYIVYLLGTRMRSRRTGLMAAAFFGLSRLAVGIDHFAFFDTPLTFLCALSVLLVYQIMSRGTVRDYLLSGLVVGAAIATKYNGAALVVPFAVAHAYRALEEKRWKTVAFDPRPWLTGLMVLAGFVICCPFSVLDFEHFHKALLWQFNRVNSGSFGMDVNNAWMFYLRNAMPYSFGIGLTVCSIGGLAAAALRRRKEELVIASFAFCYLLYIGSWKVGVNKYLMPILPMLALMAALFVTVSISAIFKKRDLVAGRAMIAVAVLLLLDPFARSVHNGYLLSQKDTRTLAKEWIEQNVPENSRIAVDGGNFDLAKFSPPLNDSEQSLKNKMLRLQIDTPEMWESAKGMLDQYFAIKLKHLHGMGYELFHIVHTIDNEIDPFVNINEFAKKGIQYVSVSSYAYEKYYDPVYSERNPEKAAVYSRFYDELEDRCVPLKEFVPISKEGPGPLIKIYKVNYE
jgi:hypothetical protein